MRPIFNAGQPRLPGVLAGIASAGCLATLFLTPILVLSGGPGELFRELLLLTPYENPLEVPARLSIVSAQCWVWIWGAGPERIFPFLLLALPQPAAAVLLLRLCCRLSFHSADRRNRL